MPFHVEIRRSFSHARAFNLDEGELRRAVLEPWSRGAAVRLGQRDWDPRACGLTVLEGPRLASAELSHGQGWHRAERSGRDVTRALLSSAGGPAAAVAVVAAGDADRRAAVAALETIGLAAVDFADVRATVLAAPPGRAGVRAAVVVVGAEAPTVAWGLDAGLAIGALGASAVVVSVGGARPPAGLAGIEPVRLEQPDALAARLRAAAPQA